MVDAIRLSSAGTGAALLGIAVSASLPSVSHAQEYCIACFGPEAVYRCVVEQGKPTGTPLKQLCVGILTREGKHTSCAVTGGTVFDCVGPIHRIDASTAAKVLANPVGPPAKASTPPKVPSPNPGSPPNPGGDKPPAKPVLADQKGPPQTVEQLAKDMARGSGDTLGKAGTAIGGTSRKAWDCVASLFKSC